MNIVLGIETSCDETGLAIYHREKGLMAHSLYSQIVIHADYGGVVPELASRDHIRKVLPLIVEVLEKAGLTLQDLDGIAYTAGPGLLGSLMVGASIAKSLGVALSIPTLGVHHMEAHLLAPLLEKASPSFPFVALLVSGGHTLLAEVTGLGCYQLLGESLDDAAGEAFDKTAKLLGLNYPGGPNIAKIATLGKPGQYKFPRPMTDRPGLDFSFSGLKTAVLNTVNSVANNEAGLEKQTKADIAYEFEQAVVDTLVIKSLRALKLTGLNQLIIAGGVAANIILRQKLEQRLAKINASVFYARPEFCTDNGAMVAHLGYLRLELGERETCSISVRSRWSIADLVPPSVN